MIAMMTTIMTKETTTTRTTRATTTTATKMADQGKEDNKVEYEGNHAKKTKTSTS